MVHYRTMKNMLEIEGFSWPGNVSPGKRVMQLLAHVDTEKGTRVDLLAGHSILALIMAQNSGVVVYILQQRQRRQGRKNTGEVCLTKIGLFFRKKDGDLCTKNQLVGRLSFVAFKIDGIKGFNR